MSDNTVVGIDLGGTKIEAALYDPSTWEQLNKKRIPTRADDSFDAVLNDIIDLADDMRDDRTDFVGIGVPGLVKEPDGVILKLPNIKGGENIPLKEELSKRLGVDCYVDNDANCFTLAEAEMGKGAGRSVVVGITLGTGVGGGIVVDGKLFHGANGYAGEIGHMLLQPGQPPFSTDNKRGEVEQFFSGTAMGKRCEEALSPDDYLDGAVCKFMHKSIYKEVAWMCTSLIHLLDPSIIIFGGSAGHALKPHLSDIDEELKNWMLPGTPIPEIAIAELRESPTLGAAMLMRCER